MGVAARVPSGVLWLLMHGRGRRPLAQSADRDNLPIQDLSYPRRTADLISMFACVSIDPLKTVYEFNTR